MNKEECVQTLNDLYEFSTNAKMYYASRDYHFYILKQLINEHFDNEQKIEWLKKIMGKDAFELCFKDEKSVVEWYERGMWHINKVNELSRELKQLKSSHDILVNYADEQLCLIKEFKSNPPLKFEDLKEGMWIWDNKIKEYIKLEKHCAKGLGYLGYDLKINDIDWFDLEFEENRFYLREVKEDD